MFGHTVLEPVGYLQGLGRKLQAFFGRGYLSGWLEKEAWFLIPEMLDRQTMKTNIFTLKNRDIFSGRQNQRATRKD